MSQGSQGICYFYAYPGSPVSVDVSIFNPAQGSLVLDITNNTLYQKTSALNDNSGFVKLASTASGQVLTLPTITAGLTASGSVSNDFSGSSGTFKTSTGLTTISGGLLGSVQAIVAAGAVNLTSVVATIATVGAIALTLADGTSGQIKILTMITDGGDATLTPSNLQGGTTLTFNDVGDTVTLVFAGTKWSVISNNGATLA